MFFQADLRQNKLIFMKIPALSVYSAGVSLPNKIHATSYEWRFKKEVRGVRMISTVKTPLQEKVKARLQADWLLKNFPIDIIDDEGIIILQGGVPSKSIAQLIEDLVKQVDGVVGISSALYIQSQYHQSNNN